MKTTLALSWKALVSKIHPPLLMTPRESRKLLALLQASFQRRLDAQHPAGLENTSHSTASHIQSILGNPLFGLNSSRRRISSVKPSQAVDRSLNGLHYWMKQPLDAFLKGVSNGTASLETAKLCLEIQLRNCLFPSASMPGGVTDTTGAGSAVLNWLWSSGMQESGFYLKDVEVIRLLTVFLVIEQRYDIVYDWFLQLQNQDPAFAAKLSKKSQTTQPNLLLGLIQSETQYGAGLGAAMVHFTQYFQRKMTDSFWANRKVYGPAGSFLAHGLAEPGKAEAVPKDILLSFTATTRGWAESSSLASAILYVYRPENPRPQIALYYLQQLSMEKLETLSGSRRSRLILMSLRTVELLLSSNQRTGADWIMNFIQTNFAEEVGTVTASRQRESTGMKSPVKDEANSLQLLETLGVP